ncbi:peptidase inhibitor family I36 protein [Actinacidiphila guanduensis]|uniref:Peptidase inhibitor family I36 n=1 Tax=Actinacidiphila guanduensis TaxID=310781 RepID=A0A1H0QR59_9ACTN|nr:peptidase inhibitor family I36 protein [Actinacidiphila guanduensis]SDP19229.1 Peptidase inhibitor family I36 [Actinacidiphila guanduensis]
MAGKLKAALTVAMGTAGLLGAAVAPAAAASQSNWSSCPSGYFCAWTGSNGTGSRCQWVDDAETWEACSWAGDGVDHPHSVYNHGVTGLGVTIFRDIDWHSPIGACVTQGKQVNLAGTYDINSHAWDCRA